MKKVILQTVIFLSSFLCYGQKEIKPADIKRNSVYIEAFGQGLYNSFSFDRLYSLDKKVKTSFSAGVTLIPHPELFVVAAPVSYNWLLGKRSHHIELGIGFTAMYLRQGRINASESYTDQNSITYTNNFKGHSTDFYSFLTPKVGYRFQKPDGGIFLRLTFTPPLAGINRIGDVKGGEYEHLSWTNMEYFTSAAFFGYRAFPWAGFSVGWTLKE